MEGKSEKFTLICLIALLAFNTTLITPVFSHTFPPRSYLGDGAGAATFEIVPQDTNVTSTKPVDLRAGEWFNIQIRIKDHSHVAYWQVKILYKTALLSTSVNNITVAGSDYIFRGMGQTAWTESTGTHNGTHSYALFGQGTNPYIEAPSRADDGIATIDFKILADPDPGLTLSTMLYIWVSGAAKTYTLDYDLLENDCTMLDGYFENKYVPPPPANLEISPTVKEMPVIEGDRIVGTPRALFSVDILIKDVSPADELFFVQLELYYRHDLIRGIWVDEGTFMNNPAWAPHGTVDNATEIDPVNATCSKMIYWVMIAPNATSGSWDNTEWPSGDGLLATARFEVIWQGPDSNGIAPEELLDKSPLELEGVFNHFFIGHPNLPEPMFLNQGTPINGTFNIYGYYWRNPVASFTWTPQTPRVGESTTFNASASYGYRNVQGAMVADPSLIANYTWSWGDGTPNNSTTNPVITHVYDATGDYNVTLTVTDNDGKTNSISQLLILMYKLTITTSLGGTTNPVPGEYFYLPGTNVNVRANASAGYYFNRWELDGAPAGSTNPITVTMDSAHTLHANFSSVLPSPSILEVTADVGNLHFPGETAEFYVFVTFQGMPANATTKSFKLYFSGALLTDLTGDLISTGLYRVRYSIPTTATPGTYMLVVQVEYYSARANTLKSFMISQMLNARLTAIENGVATLSTDLGVVKANLTDIKATITGINGQVVSISSTLGDLETTLSAINARVVSIDGKVVTLETDLGTVQTTLDDVGAAIASTQTMLYVTAALSAIAAIVAILVLVLFLRKRR